MNRNKSADPIESFLSAPPINKIKIGKTDLSASRPWKRLFLAQLSVMMSVLELMDYYLEKVASSPTAGVLRMLDSRRGASEREGHRRVVTPAWSSPPRGRIRNWSRWRLLVAAAGLAGLSGRRNSPAPLRISQSGKIKTDWIFKLDAIAGGKAPVAAERLGVEGFVASQNMWILTGADVFQADLTCTFDGPNKTHSGKFLPMLACDFSLMTRKPRSLPTSPPPPREIWSLGGRNRA
jgi:hypothetical protein